jgi:hypothetical protein
VKQNRFVHIVNRQDEITFVDEAWLTFAKKNDWSDAGTVVGTSLWDHISDTTARHLYHLWMTQVRGSGKPITVPFRCDSPDARRFMELQISRQDQHLVFASRLIREEPREHIALLDFRTPRDSQILKMCLWCKKINTSTWVPTEAAVRELNLFDAPVMPMLTHVTCPDCEAIGLSSVIE